MSLGIGIGINQRNVQRSGLSPTLLTSFRDGVLNGTLRTGDEGGVHWLILAEYALDASSVTSATMNLNVTYNNSDSPKTNVQGHDVDTPDNTDPDGWASVTTAFSQWAAAAMSVGMETLDITDVVNEILGRGGYSGSFEVYIGNRGGITLDRYIDVSSAVITYEP